MLQYKHFVGPGACPIGGVVEEGVKGVKVGQWRGVRY